MLDDVRIGPVDVGELVHIREGRPEVVACPLPDLVEVCPDDVEHVTDEADLAV